MLSVGVVRVDLSADICLYFEFCMAEPLACLKGYILTGSLYEGIHVGVGMHRVRALGLTLNTQLSKRA